MSSRKDHKQRASELHKVINLDTIDPTTYLEALNCSGRPLDYHGTSIRSDRGLCQIGGHAATTILVTRWYRAMLPRKVGKDFVEAALDDDALCKIGKAKGIDKLIVVADEKKEPSTRDVSCSVVALVGAALLHAGYDAAQAVVERLGIGDEAWDALSR